MNKSTRISGVDCKIGRNSRTGSTATFTISDDEIIDVVEYFNCVKSNKEPTGKIKKIELIMYSEVDLTTEPNIDESIKTLEDVIIEQDEETEKSHPTGLDIFQEVPRVGRVYDGNGNKL